MTLPNGKTYTTPDYSAIDGSLNPNFGAINAVDNSGLSVYNGLLVHFATIPGSSCPRSPTPSHTTDQGTGYYNQFDQAAQRGPSQLDQTHRFVATGVWSPQYSRV